MTEESRLTSLKVCLSYGIMFDAESKRSWESQITISLSRLLACEPVIVNRSHTVADTCSSTLHLFTTELLIEMREKSVREMKIFVGLKNLTKTGGIILVGGLVMILMKIRGTGINGKNFTRCLTRRKTSMATTIEIIIAPVTAITEAVVHSEKEIEPTIAHIAMSHKNIEMMLKIDEALVRREPVPLLDDDVQEVGDLNSV
mmetsp:Transcript_12245/g.37355  ORF Transcript_12245/g.37355 Transcript_12245/m.37355 type:complete len:201 (-) Transcript_12245:198-800(-)